MGLDVVELVMRVEDEFRIQIPEEAWPQLRTVGDLSRCVALAVGQVPSLGCPSVRAFTSIRRALLPALGADRQAIRPTTMLEQIPRADRPRVWRTLATETGFQFPALATSWRGRLAVLVVVLLYAGPLVLVVVSLAVGLPFLAGVAIATFGTLSVVLLAVASVRWIDALGLARELPAGCVTVGDLVRRVTLPHALTDTRATQPSNSDQIYLRVKRIVCEHLNVPPEQVTPQSRFIGDLRVD